MHLIVTSATVIGLALSVYLLLRSQQRSAQIERLLLGLGSALKDAERDARGRAEALLAQVAAARQEWAPRLKETQGQVADLGQGLLQAVAQGESAHAGLATRTEQLEQGLKETRQRTAALATTADGLLRQATEESGRLVTAARQAQAEQLGRLEATVRTLREEGERRWRDLGARLDALTPEPPAPAAPATAPQEPAPPPSRAPAGPPARAHEKARSGIQEDLGERWIFLVLALLLGLALLANTIRSQG